MKNLILPLLLILAIISCKKKENPSPSSGNNGGSGGGPATDNYVVRIESNFKRSYVTFENITDNVVMKRYNTAVDSTKNCPIVYSFMGSPGKKYRIYTTSQKNSSDTTLYMTDSGLTWNYLQVKKNGNVIYEHKDTVGYGSGYGSQRITSNECKINY